MKVKFLQAGNGDSILLSFNDGEKNRNILIDGGVEETYFCNSTGLYGELETEVDSIRERNEVIDLLILTHIDNDHICGLLKLFELDDNAYKLIKNVWFNSGKLIAQNFNESENTDLRVGLRIYSDPQTGVHEAIEFEDYLEKKAIWNKKLIIQGQKLEQYGVRIEILSPNEAQLKRLLKEYKKVTGDNTYTAGKENDWRTNIKDFIEEENMPDFKFTEDSSVKNGSSISFILTFKDLHFLFLGDSHPNDVVKQLKTLGYCKDKQLEVEFIKVSHHGSKANTSKELIEIVNTNNYVFITDSTRHNHPNKRTLARILNVNPNAIFHFNYQYVMDNVFNKNDYSVFGNFKVKNTSEFISK